MRQSPIHKSLVSRPQRCTTPDNIAYLQKSATSRMSSLSILIAVRRDLCEYSVTLHAALLTLTIRSTKSLTLNHSKKQGGTMCNDIHAAVYGRG